MKLIVAEVHGFCSGVRRALSKAKEALRQGLPCYIYGEIVHNARVSEELRQLGAREYPADAKPPAIIVIRAHGIAEDVEARLAREGFTIVDATCPVVARNKELLRKAERPVIIGDPDHAEVLTLRSVRPDAPVVRDKEEAGKLEGSYQAVLQTTYPEGKLKELKESQLPLTFLNDICPASRQRRRAVLDLLDEVDALVVAGDPSSANCNALCQLARDRGKRAWLVKSKEDLSSEIRSCVKIGLTSGASTPEAVFEEVKEDLQSD